jgi:DNA-directed RNA polymerase specialized sigma24 family protein
MLMTYASPELLPTTAGSADQADLPVTCRHLEPDAQSRDERKSAFELQFARSRRLLYFVAHRILHCIEEAEEAVKNCRLTASCNPPRFTSEGAFKSWLVRILIDEATLLLRQKQNNQTQNNSTASSETKAAAE